MTGIAEKNKTQNLNGADEPRAGDRVYLQPEINQVEALSAKLISLNRQLEEKNRQLEQSELARKNLFSNITHDIRTPVSAIRGAAERLGQKGLGADEQMKMIKIIDSRAQTLERLVEELHFSILIDQPEFKLSLSSLEIAPILEEYFISMEGAGHFDGRLCRLEIPDGMASRVLIDPQYFIRVLDNLLSNAMKHTGLGGRISLGCREAGENVEIWVSDSGDGIPAGDLPYIFERTFTGSNARTPGQGGSGLGLYIVKAIVEKHMGSIHCESVYGEGAAFRILLQAVS